MCGRLPHQDRETHAERGCSVAGRAITALAPACRPLLREVFLAVGRRDNRCSPLPFWSDQDDQDMMCTLEAPTLTACPDMGEQ